MFEFPAEILEMQKAGFDGDDFLTRSSSNEVVIPTTTRPLIMHRIPMRAAEILAIAPGEGGYTGRLYNCSFVLFRKSRFIIPAHLMPLPHSDEVLQVISALSLLSEQEHPVEGWEDVYSVKFPLVEEVAILGRAPTILEAELSLISRIKPAVHKIGTVDPLLGEAALEALVDGAIVSTIEPISVIFYNVSVHVSTGIATEERHPWRK